MHGTQFGVELLFCDKIDPAPRPARGALRLGASPLRRHPHAYQGRPRRRGACAGGAAGAFVRSREGPCARSRHQLAPDLCELRLDRHAQPRGGAGGACEQPAHSRREDLRGDARGVSCRRRHRHAQPSGRKAAVRPQPPVAALPDLGTDAGGVPRLGAARGAGFSLHERPFCVGPGVARADRSAAGAPGVGPGRGPGRGRSGRGRSGGGRSGRGGPGGGRSGRGGPGGGRSGRGGPGGGRSTGPARQVRQARKRRNRGRNRRRAGPRSGRGRAAGRAAGRPAR